MGSSFLQQPTNTTQLSFFTFSPQSPDQRAYHASNQPTISTLVEATLISRSESDPTELDTHRTTLKTLWGSDAYS